MWKTHFIIDSKDFVFHSPCGKRCGKLSPPVDKKSFPQRFEFSTAPDVTEPVEMWKTFFNFLKINGMFRHDGNRPVEIFLPDNPVTICKYCQ